MPWMGAARLAAVSSFGFSGTNAHVLLGEAPVQSRPAVRDGGPALILLSGRTAEALEARREDLLRWLETHTPSLADLAFTLGHGRSHFEHRLAVVVESVDDLRAGRGRSWKSEPLVLPRAAARVPRSNGCCRPPRPTLPRSPNAMSPAATATGRASQHRARAASRCPAIASRARRSR